MVLDLSSLKKAVDSLERAVKVASENGAADSDTREVIRAGVIQNFEFTYELCWKFIKRWLEVNGAGASIDGITRKELFRMASENQLIFNIEQWFKYHAARNETAHTYDCAKADEIYLTAKVFVADAKKLLQELEKRND